MTSANPVESKVMTSSPHDAFDGVPPSLAVRKDAAGELTAVLLGDWTLKMLALGRVEIERTLARHGENPRLAWDLCAVRAIDSAGALILWQAWGQRIPQRLAVQPRHHVWFDKWLGSDQALAEPTRRRPSPETLLSRPARSAAAHVFAALVVLGELLAHTAYFIAHPRRIPWRETAENLYEAGVRALGMTALVGALVGVVIPYQAAVQLKPYGAEVFVIQMLGFSITRELGPMLAAALVAGRSASAITAQLGAMRVTQELDALAVLGISATQRLVFPKVVALTLALPLLAFWTDLLAITGGMIAARSALGVPYAQFFSLLPASVPVVNFWIGLGKAAVFGALIAMTAAHFGLRVEPNTRSLSRETTGAVVTAMILVITLDAIFAFVLRDVGFNR